MSDQQVYTLKGLQDGNIQVEIETKAQMEGMLARTHSEQQKVSTTRLARHNSSKRSLQVKESLFLGSLNLGPADLFLIAEMFYSFESCVEGLQEISLNRNPLTGTHLLSHISSIH
jgi:hypothetical protein